jgi:hypothetical protein
MNKEQQTLDSPGFSQRAKTRQATQRHERTLVDHLALGTVERLPFSRECPRLVMLRVVHRL